MKKLQFYKYTTWGLLGMNLLMLVFFFLKGARHNDGLRAIDTLKLDKQQHAVFLVSAQRHEAKMEEIVDKQADLLHPYFNQLVNQAEIDADLFSTYQTLEIEKIKATFQHFQEIKDILKPEQQADFELFMGRMLPKILPKPKKNNHPPKDF